jgi:hypothetical protein
VKQNTYGVNTVINQEISYATTLVYKRNDVEENMMKNEVEEQIMTIDDPDDCSEVNNEPLVLGDEGREVSVRYTQDGDSGGVIIKNEGFFFFNRITCLFFFCSW